MERGLDMEVPTLLAEEGEEKDQESTQGENTLSHSIIPPRPQAPFEHTDTMSAEHILNPTTFEEARRRIDQLYLSPPSTPPQPGLALIINHGFAALTTPQPLNHTTLSKLSDAWQQGLRPLLKRSEIPPEPTRYRGVKKHPFRTQWREAEAVEFNNLILQKTFERVPIEFAITPLLPLMWVYAYKWTVGATVERFKARLVVRGDQMTWGNRNNYAATLATKSFRLVLAIIAYFDLETIQLDAVAAFLNCYLEEAIYARFPPGKDEPGFCLRLRRALYGLPQAPRLWLRTLLRALIELGGRALPEEPYIDTTKHLIIFFFVDDITIAFRKEHRE
jgi:hypothetical protein